MADDFQLPSADWDVIVSGTGVKSSLLAVALSRTDLKVLQLDPASYYGSTEAAFSLDELQTWASTAAAPFYNVTLDKRDEGRLARSRAYTISLAPTLVYWNSTLLGMLREADMTQSFEWQAAGSWWVWLTEEDVAAGAEAGGAGGLGELAMEAGVKVAKAAARKKGGWNKGRQRHSAPLPAATLAEEGAEGTSETPDDASPPAPSTAGATAGSEPEFSSALRTVGSTLREVPCTFEDIAWSSTLSDRHRGHLGRFLRFVASSQAPANPDSADATLLAANATTPLTTFLAEHYPLPPALVASLHSLTLLPTPPDATPLSAAVARLALHVSSLGRIADIRSAAALTIAYGGAAELCQVWSRGAAVAGGINVLERGITAVSPSPSSSDRKLAVELSNGEAVSADWVVRDSGAAEASERVLKGAFVIGARLQPLFQGKYADDRVSPTVAVVTFPVGALSVDGEGGVRNAAPVYVVAHAGGNECPRDQTLLYTLAAVQECGRGLVEAAVRAVLKACDVAEEGQVLLALQYEQASSGGEMEDGGEGQEVRLMPLGVGVAFDEGAVEECRRIYEKIMGTRDGFMKLPERLKVHAEEE